MLVPLIFCVSKIGNKKITINHFWRTGVCFCWHCDTSIMYILTLHIKLSALLRFAATRLSPFHPAAPDSTGAWMGHVKFLITEKVAFQKLNSAENLTHIILASCSSCLWNATLGTFCPSLTKPQLYSIHSDTFSNSRPECDAEILSHELGRRKMSWTGMRSMRSDRNNRADWDTALTAYLHQHRFKTCLKQKTK